MSPNARDVHAENLANAAVLLGEALGELPDVITAAAQLVPADAPPAVCRALVDRIVRTWMLAHPFCTLRIVATLAAVETSRRAAAQVQPCCRAPDCSFPAAVPGGLCAQCAADAGAPGAQP